jgi:glycosyltransferase involved in cell wall biosynthesis
MNTRTIRLAILGTKGIPARYGGFETFAEELGARLVTLGIDVTVYCELDGTPGPPEHRGIGLIYVPAPRRGPLTTILFDLRCLWHARKGYDIVYMLGYGAAAFCFLPRLWGTTVWLNVDGVEWARAKWGFAARLYFKLMETLAVKVPDRVVADAHAIRDHLIRRHSAHKPISVIAYGAQVVNHAPATSPLSEWRLTPNGYYLVVCRLEPENHVLEIIDGYCATESARPLIVVGNHQSPNSYMRRLQAVRDPRVRFIGTVFDRSKLQALRYHAFAYCHGHSVGGTNPSLLEALGCGNAILAHNNPFNREAARDAALYFESSRNLAQHINELERDELRRQRMRSQASLIVGTDYTWDLIATQYIDLISGPPAPGISASRRAANS